LVEVKKDGTVVESYTYDANGNRTAVSNALRGINGKSFSYSVEDHVISVGSDSFVFDVDGFLQRKATLEGTTYYQYSSRGELLRVDRPDGIILSYVHDPLGRRIAKQINGATVEKYLWSGPTTLLAVYDGRGNLLERFTYADARTPVSMTAGGGTYFLLTDQVGTLRAVADTSGAIVKRIDYDSFGNIVADSNPAFMVPFGFAGGLHDRDTGLVRFGYRDYSPELGRFVAKDPVDFEGGDTNLYAYSMSDPVNFVDPLGLDYIPNVVINLDPTPYRAYGDAGPNSPNQNLTIPPGGHLGPIPIIGMTPPWWDVDFICSPSGWRKVKVGGVISGGCVIGGMDPPPDWTPPSQCP
jgi:RHS repeat-associated protein